MSSRTEYALPFTIETLIVVSEKLPLFGLAFCVIWSIIFDFEEATKTHCEVENFAPSISSSLSFLTQKYVWQVVIALLVVPRIIFLLSYKRFYEFRISTITQNSDFQSHFSWLVKVTLTFNALELISLLGLTIVTSEENFDVHKVCFVTFALSSLIYFILTCSLWKYCGINKEINGEKKSFDEKKFWLKLYFVLGIPMSILYYWHNEYCQDYVYSFFCICEYVIVYAIIKFHGTAKYDFADINIVIPSSTIGQYLPLHAA